MAVKYVPTQGWIFDTPAEAAQFYRLVNSARVAIKQTGTAPVVPASLVLPNAAKRLIQKLLEAHPESVPGSDLAGQLGIKPSDLGNVVVSIARWGEQFGLTRKEMILKRRKRIGGGKSVRTLRLAPSFEKAINKRKIKI